MLQRHLIYDGHCQFCSNCVRRIKALDRSRKLQFIDLHQVKDLSALHPRLTKELVMSRLHLVESPRSDGTSASVSLSGAEGGNKLYGGFYALRRLCLVLPGLYPLIPIVYFPGMGLVGPFFYRLIAKNRYAVCAKNSCFRNLRGDKK